MRGSFIIFFLSCVFWAIGGPSTDPGNDKAAVRIKAEFQPLFENQQINHLISQFRDKERNGYHLQKLFYKVHRRFLKDYIRYADLKELSYSGKYDCLTGSILFAYILDSLNYDYELIELDYHTYVTVKIEREDYILEATDPLQGFVSGTDVKVRLEEYLNDQSDKFYKRRVSLAESPGLIYYNESIDLFNNGDYLRSFETLVSGFDFLSTRNMEQLLKLSLAQLVAIEDIDEETLRKCLDIYLSLTHAEPVVFSTN